MDTPAPADGVPVIPTRSGADTRRRGRSLRPPRTCGDRIAIACRARHFSLSTERSYVHWAKRLAAWHGRVHPAKLGNHGNDVQAFLNHLAVEKRCAPSTCKQALCALQFLY
ncbi:site-specific integrase, partial [Paucibacter sp. O1-1]|nr:phage integrase N-terminal SAM-like domain-containing protein [Paucibacter sp. O1-1]MDA3825257.1 site-specific integrase [Paucibacter sp. O1-1]